MYRKHCFSEKLRAVELYESLQVTKPRGRSPKTMGRPKKREPQTELEKLRARNEWLEAQNALLKMIYSAPGWHYQHALYRRMLE